MKKNGFTLVEIILALTVVGVVAALAIPPLVSNYRKQSYSSVLSNAISTFETAMGANMLKEGVDDLLDTEAWKGIKSSTIYTLKNLSTTKDEEINTFMGNLGKSLALSNFNKTKLAYKKLASGSYSSTDLNDAVRFIAKNGVEYLIYISDVKKSKAKSESDAFSNNVNYTNKAAVVYIDVNGAKLPNILGRDLFKFDLGTDGKLYPHGSSDYCYFNEDTYSDIEKECVTNKKGEFCAAYLIKNGYKMDY